MKTIKIILGVVLGLVILTDSLAQTENTSKQKMKALAMLEGEWEGEGWMITPSRERKDFTQKEWIAYQLDGTILQVQGKGRNSEEAVIHNAFAIMSYDQAAAKYAMYSYLEDGRQTKADLEVLSDREIKWWFQTPDGGTVRYHIKIEQNTWVEIGEYSRDGITWFPFIQFTLTRTS